MRARASSQILSLCLLFLFAVSKRNRDRETQCWEEEKKTNKKKRRKKKLPKRFFSSSARACCCRRRRQKPSRSYSGQRPRGQRPRLLEPRRVARVSQRRAGAPPRRQVAGRESREHRRAGSQVVRHRGQHKQVSVFVFA